MARPNQENWIRDKLIPISVAVLATVGVLSVRSCIENSDRDWTLPQQEFDEACNNSELHLGFRGSDTREGFGTLEATEYAGRPVRELEERFFPDTPEDIALESIKGANPNLRVDSGDDTLPDTANVSVRVNISNFAKEKLPEDKKLVELGDELGFDKNTIACVNRMDPEAHFDHDTAVFVPRQVATDGKIKSIVVKPGDTYESVAKANGVELGTIVPGNEQSLNSVYSHAIENGDILYVGENETSGKPEFVDPDQETKNFIDKYIGYAKEVEQKYGVPYQVTLAQALVETGYGTSELAKNAHNFHGLKANEEWSGPTYKKDSPELATEDDLKKYEGHIVSQTKRPDGKYDLIVTSVFKAFATDEEGFRGFGDHLRSRLGGTAYADAFVTKNPDEFLMHLFDNEGSEFATDDKYIEKVTRFLKIIEANDVPSIQEESREGETDLQKIFDSYKADERYIRRNDGECIVGADNVEDGTPKEQGKLADFDLFKIAYANIDNAHPNKEGYEAFNVIDQRDAARAANPNFDGSNVPLLGKPSNIKEEVKHFIIHFTAIPGVSADGYDGVKLATAMKNQDSAGINYYTNFDGQTANTFYLSDTFTYQAPSENGFAFGIETSGCNQAKIRPEEINNDVYMSTRFLIENGYVDVDSPSGSIVDQVIVGHGELAGHKHPTTGKSDNHSDWTKAYMDPFRSKVKKLLVDLGYKA